MRNFIFVLTLSLVFSLISNATPVSNNIIHCQFSHWEVDGDDEEVVKLKIHLYRDGSYILFDSSDLTSDLILPIESYKVLGNKLEINGSLVSPWPEGSKFRVLLNLSRESGKIHFLVPNLNNLKPTTMSCKP